MGVKNLWRLLLPVGHRLSIETLSHQTLAIDASIWLTQVSKACRDPETGRLLPNKPHVRIFLLRLMRLLYHQIKPVVVFDGVMPEVKRREIQRRKDRRERLWRDDEDGTERGGALKRAAKKILVKQLKEWREKEARLQKGGSKGGDDDVGVDGNTSPAKADSSRRPSNGGAFAAGFTPLDEEAPSGQPTQTDGKRPERSNCKTTRDDDVISINSNDSREDAKSEMKVAAAVQEEYESENDWEMTHAVQSSISDSIRQQQRYHNYDDNPFEHEHYQQASNETIAALPSESRSKWIDSQRAARRIQSRKECIQAAANPASYSNAQLKNFLMGSKLNKRVGEIGKLVEKRVEDGEFEGGGGFEANVELQDGNARQERPMQRLRRHGSGHSSDDDEDNYMFDVDAAQASASMKVLFGEDDSDDEGGGGGFLLSSSASEAAAAAATASSVQNGSEKKEVVLLNSDSDNDGESPADGVELLADKSKHANGHVDGKLPSNGTRQTTKSSKLFELTSAGQEWENWGVNIGENENSVEASEPNTSHEAAGVKANDDGTALDASESGSDDEGGTFLTLGSAVRPSISVGAEPVSANTQHAAMDEDGEGVEDEDDDIDWEDGDSVDDQGEGEAEVDVKDGISGATDELQDEETGGKSDSERAHIDLTTEGEAAEKMLKPNDENDAIELLPEDDVCSSKGEIASDQSISRRSSLALESEDDRLLIAKPGESTGENEFDSFHPDNDTAAALQHAQETASRLTSWAGRAFERAISAHVGHKPLNGSPSQNDGTGKKQVDETANHSIDVTSSDVEADLATDGKRPSLDKSNHAGAEGTPESPHEQQYSSKKWDLFDTSLEGLTEAHDIILEEERAMERDLAPTITDEMKDDILALLRLCGIPWVESPSEAEAQCAALEELGLVDGIVTEDSDVFVFGAQKVYKHFFDEKKFVEAYFARDIKRDLALGKHQLVALAMLLGGDYTDGVKGVGIVNGMEILQAFTVDDSEEGVRDGLQRFRGWLEQLDGFDGPANAGSDEASKALLFHRKHKSARTRWACPADFPSAAIVKAYLHPAVDKSEAKFSWAKPDLLGLQHFCAEKLGWEQEETDRVVNPVLKVLESGSKQTRLESYFMKYEDNITFAKVRSKRLKAVLTDIQGSGDPADDADFDSSDVDKDGSIPESKRQRKE